MATPNMAFTEVPADVAPDVPYWTNKALREVDTAVYANKTKTDANEAKLSNALYYRGVLANNTDFNTLTDQSHNGFYTLSAANTYPNAPFTGFGGELLVLNSGAGTGRQEVTKASSDECYTRTSKNFFATPKTFGIWRLDANIVIDIVAGQDLNDLRVNNDYMIQSTTVANSVLNFPPNIPKGPLYLRVRATAGGIVFQQGQNYGAGATTVFRSTLDVNTTPFPFGDWKAPLTAAPVQVGLANKLRLDSFTQRMGGRFKTGQKGAVAFRLDHGLNNAYNIVRPILEPKNVPYGMAINARNFGTGENNAVTAPMIDALAAGGLAEVWNHGAHHNDATAYSTLYDVIVNGLLELRALLPSFSIDGWLVPGVGVGSTNYAGFNGGATPENFYNTIAGQLILEWHAVSSGAFPNSAQRVLDGTVRQGMGHFTMDAETPASIIAQIDQAIANKTGLQLMLHPNELNKPGNLTTAGLNQVVDYVDAKRTADTLAVLSPYKLLLADAT